MLEASANLPYGHNFWLIVPGAGVCFAASVAALGMTARDTGAARPQMTWLFAAAAVCGCGAFATQLMSLLALPSDAAMVLAPWAALLSCLIAIGGAGFGFYAARMRAGTYVGGGVIAASVMAMHFTGIMGLHGAKNISWNIPLLLLALIVGAGAAVMSLRRAPSQSDWRGRLGGAVLLTTATVAIQFGGLTALTVTPDPAMSALPSLVGGIWFAVALAVVFLLIAGIAAIGAVSDHYVAEIARAHSDSEYNTRKLTEALQEADRSNALKSQFLATMSHELRTPLNAIIGFSEIMQNEIFGPLGNERYREYAADVCRSGTHLLGLINDILDLAKFDAGMLELREDIIELSGLVTDCITIVSIQADRAGVHVQALTGDEMVWVRVDPKRIKQVLLNLLSNAVKFTPAAGEVTVSVFRAADGVSIAVSDTGIGMSAEEIPKALERFGQIDSTLGRKYEGTGLGLPLTKTLVELHGGRLDIASKPHVGTTVTVALPSHRCLPAEPARAIA